jgi:hypothetical protein
MCYVCLKCETILQDLIKEKVSNRVTFTIWEIIHTSKDLFCPGCYSDASTHARDLFNRHNDVWVGYACYPIPNGPLLFFPVPHYLLNRVGKIGLAVSNKEQTTTAI